VRLRTRFAPSPTGYLHVGNAYSALICQQWAEEHGAELLLRIEDIDHTRCEKAFIQALMDDLAWLGMRWSGHVRHQSDFLGVYQDALERLREMEVIYPCFCSRRHIRNEIERMGLAPHADNPANAYPGLCRRLNWRQRRQRMRSEPFAWRLDIAAAFARLGEPLSWRDGRGRHHAVHASAHADEVIGRKDIGISYHLAVIVDDAAQGITHVIRGEDIRPSTGLHRLLQALLGLPEPAYIHHPLLRDSEGNKLSKRHGAPTLRQLRQAGVDPGQLRRALLDGDRIWPPHKTAWHGVAFAT